MTRTPDAALARLSERPEIAEDVAIVAAEIGRLRGWKASAIEALDDLDLAWKAAGSPGPLGGLKAENVRAEIERLRAERDRLREAIRWHRLAAEEAVGAPTDDHENYEPFDHALWDALRESPVPDGPAPLNEQTERWLERAKADAKPGPKHAAPSHPTGEERRDAEA